MQPRHIKLAFAGRERNWSYAAYELHELEEAFERAARSWPTWRAVPIAEMMTSLTKQPMAALTEAIKSADTMRFAAAYGQLTEVCNTCHQGANRGMIAIRVPDSSPFSDQDFRPPKQ
ncbi:MAG: cytochrome family protein [Proteobacteria bacterium]|nr:cytochrome family protein [Pseudomonadota bacterium]